MSILAVELVISAKQQHIEWDKSKKSIYTLIHPPYIDTNNNLKREIQSRIRFQFFRPF